MYCVNLTPPDIEEAGYCVVRVLIPGMTEITNDTVYPRLGGQRLRQLPVTLGYKSEATKFADFYRVPHPFP